MAKLYSKNSKDSLKRREANSPKKETVTFLLNYSKALKMSKYKSLEFETILN